MAHGDRVKEERMRLNLISPFLNVLYKEVVSDWSEGIKLVWLYGSVTVKQ